MSKAPRAYRLKTLFQKIGEVSVIWGFLDIATDSCIQELHYGWGGEKANLEIPRTSFYKKLTYLRDWYASDSRYAILFPEFLTFVQMLEDAAEHRHRLIHGIALDLDNYPKTGLAILTREIRRKKKAVRETVTYNTKGITIFRNHVFGLTAFTGTLCEIFSGGSVAEDKPENSFSALFVKVGGFFPRTKRRRHALGKRR